ncbi:MAG: hypothetical protein ACXADY_15580 [Candidatus Hodarchaeales archaeon]|jgi:hypothetical protein
MQIKLKHKTNLFLIFILVLGLQTVTAGIAAVQSSILDLSVVDIYAKDQSQTYAYDLWNGQVDPSNDDFEVTISVSEMTGVSTVILYLRLWEWENNSYWASYSELNWTTEGGASDPLTVNWYNLVPSSLAGTKQKIDFRASTADGSAWQASISVEISIIAEFVAEGWIESPEKQGESPSPSLTSGFEGIILVASLFIPIIYHKTRKRR